MAFVGDLALYRFVFNGHLYTTDCNEAVNIIHNQWRYEATQCHIASASAPGLVPLYRLLGNGMHFCTADEQEKSNLVGGGWALEGTIGYVSPVPTVDTVPLYRGLDPNNSDHFYTTDQTEMNLAIQAGWVGEGIACYVSSNATRDCGAILQALFAVSPAQADGVFQIQATDAILFGGGVSIGPGTRYQSLTVTTLPSAGWSWDRSGNRCGASGNGTLSGAAPIPNAPEGCLLWRRSHYNANRLALTDDLGNWTQDLQTITLSTGGLYSFGINDGNVGDNSGSLAVQLTYNTY